MYNIVQNNDLVKEKIDKPSECRISFAEFYHKYLVSFEQKALPRKETAPFLGRKVMRVCQ